MELLLERRASVDPFLTVGDVNYANMPLYYAAENGHDEVVRRLLVAASHLLAGRGTRSSLLTICLRPDPG